MLEVGRVCLKTAGREAGRYCVVVKKMDESFVMITGPKELTSVKRRRCNVNHLEPIMEVLKIKSDAADGEVIKAYQSANLTKKLGLEPSKAKPAKEAKPEKPKPRKQEPKEAKKPERKAEPKKEKPKVEKPKAVKKPEKKPSAKPKTKKAPVKKSPAKKAASKTKPKAAKKKK